LHDIVASLWLLCGLLLPSYLPLLSLSIQHRGECRERDVKVPHQIAAFVNDKIAPFDIPALEIDTDVAGLMVIRGLSISLSTLTIIVHGVEVRIKLSDDLELAIQTEKVTIPLFRRIEVSDCMTNVKVRSS
jgi:hypothetical protein